MRSLAVIPVFCCLVAVAGISSVGASDIEDEGPATFEAELPCADCPGIFYHLDLLPGGTCFLRTTFLNRGTGAIRDEVGSWTAESGAILLDLAGDGPSVFQVVDRDTLRVLDGSGPHIEVSAGHDLRRKDSMGTISPRVSILGQVDESGTFEECLSGRRFTIAQGNRLDELQREGMVLVTLQALISFEPTENKGDPQLSIRPEKIIETLPGKSCRDLAAPN